MTLGTLCYIRKRDSTLLLHRTKKNSDSMKGYWIGLGGRVKIEDGESPEECVTREVREESGLVIKPTLRGIVTFRHIEPDIEDWYAYLFTASQFHGRIIDSNEGDLEWISDNQLHRINIPEGDRHFLRWLRQDNRIFSAKFEYKNKKLIRHTVIYY